VNRRDLGDSAQRLQGLDHLLHLRRCQLHCLCDSLFQSPDAVAHMLDLVQVIQQRKLLRRLLKVHLLLDPLLKLLRLRLDPCGRSSAVAQQKFAQPVACS
jgi:hypothetical protein